MEFMAVLAPNQLPSSFEGEEKKQSEPQEEAEPSDTDEDDVQVTGGEA